MEVILKLIIDASSTQLYMLGWRVSPANFVDEVGLIHESTYNMDVFVATTSCFLQGSGLYIAVIVEVILKLLLDASSTQQYMFAWRVYLANFVGEKSLKRVPSTTHLVQVLLVASVYSSVSGLAILKLVIMLLSTFRWVYALIGLALKAFPHLVQCSLILLSSISYF